MADRPSLFCDACGEAHLGHESAGGVITATCPKTGGFLKERAPRRCPTCWRPFAGSGGVDLLKHCPRAIPGDAYILACLLEGLRLRDQLLDGLRSGKCARVPLPCDLPEGHDGRCSSPSAADRLARAVVDAAYPNRGSDRG